MTKTDRVLAGVCSLASIGASLGVASADVTFDFVTVGDTTYAADPLTTFGRVTHEYRIATTEVSVGQYLEFLNAAAVDDINGLYDTRMFNTPPGIEVRGQPGGRSYALRPGADPDLPMTLIDFLQAMRFVNWLHNGQGPQGTPEGETETGAYTVVDGVSESREPDARFFIPSEDEWYKAAYHQPLEDGGNPSGFWLYPTSSDAAPAPGVDANYDGAAGGPVPVDAYGPNFRGLYNVAGNVWEFNEGAGQTRWVRGGWYGGNATLMRSTVRGLPLSGFGVGVGLRVAAAVPDDPACNPADLAAPPGILDLADITAFIAGFTGSDPIADLAPPTGVFDLSDIAAFSSAFLAGCP